jgi:hypothetical protein
MGIPASGVTRQAAGQGLQRALRGVRYRAGGLLEASDRLGALRPNEGNAHAAEGQADELDWMLQQGVQIASCQGDAEMPSPGLMEGLEGMVATYAMCFRGNERLDGAAHCSELPKTGGAAAFSEFRHAAKSWNMERQVIGTFQVPEAKTAGLCWP